MPSGKSGHTQHSQTAGEQFTPLNDRKTFFLNADLNGYDSIRKIIAANTNKIRTFNLPSYEVFDNLYNDLASEIEPGDFVVVDTLSMLADTTRTDFKLGTDPSKSYWKEKDRLVADTYTRNIYDAAGALTMRRLKNLKNLGAHLIVTAHERSGADPALPKSAKIRLPDLNSALCGSLIASSSIAARLTVNHEDEYDDDGNVVLPKGRRLLQVGASEDYLTKVHMDLEDSIEMPEIITRPSIPKLAKILGFVPEFLTVYAPPGVGKSTFALSHYIDLDGSGIGL